MYVGSSNDSGVLSVKASSTHTGVSLDKLRLVSLGLKKPALARREVPKAVPKGLTRLTEASVGSDMFPPAKKGAPLTKRGPSNYSN